MDPSNRLPPGLRVPAAGDLASVTWRADLGGDARLGDLADLLRDLDTVVAVGGRWGLTLARAATEHQLEYEIGRGGPRALLDAVTQLGLDRRDFDGDIDRWYFEGPWRWRSRRGRPSFWSPEALLRLLVDARTPDALGLAMQTRSVAYRNPLEVILSGSGFLLLGTITALRLVRDWSNTRRHGSAEAQEAEASARRYSAQADLMEWLVDETKAGRLHIPPSDLLNSVSAGQGEAIRRLAEQDVQLGLPPGTDPTT
jgi:hypothetical protein